MEYFVLIVEVIVLVGISAIFSGLNISLMSLDVADLRRKKNLGNLDAARVLPFREKTHLSLASILFANVAAVSATSILLEQHTGGLIAGLLTTFLMVIFGEILPQAFFVRFALKFCSQLAPLLRFTVGFTYIVSKPMQLILDKMIKHRPNDLHSRDELGMIIGEHYRSISSELDEDEVEIIQSALQMSEKTVGSIMQPIKEVYWLTDDAILDTHTIDEIKEKGYSRIPIFNHDLSTCFGVLLMKDMIDIDFTMSPQPVRSFHLHKTKLIGSRTALDTMLRNFFALRTHLVPIERDDKIIGILTVEDLIEEIIGHEIADETDHLLERE